MARSRQVEVEILRLGGAGDGVAETASGPLYVPYTLPGDVVQVEIGEKIDGGRRGRLVALIEGGPTRVEPPCPHFHTCGGCHLQHVAAPAYAEWKRQRVVSALARRGLAEVPVAPLRIIAPAERRRADLVARRVGARVLLGFHERASQRIVDLATCLVLDPTLVALFAPLRALLAERLAPGATAEIRMSLSENGADLLLLGLGPLDLAARERLATFAAETGLARLSLGDAKGGIETLVRRQPAIVRFDGVAVEPPPGSFLQASASAERILVELVKEAVGGATRIADLFAGAGTFALPLSAQAEVLAVDGAQAPLQALQKAAHAAARRVRVQLRDLDRRPLSAAELAPFEALVFDPPRAGARAQAAEIAHARIPSVAAVSCEPGSFARDAKLLIAGGYELERVTPVDQFLWSPHVELVGQFRR